MRWWSTQMYEQGRIEQPLGLQSRAEQLSAQLAQMRQDSNLGEKEEKRLRAEKLPPEREIARRQLIGIMALGLRPKHSILS